MASVTITFDLADLLGVDFDARRTKVWIDTNIANDTIIDTVAGEIRIGSGNVTLAADGTGSFSTWIPSADTNPASWQTTVHVDYPDRNSGRGGRGSRTFGPYTITASANLADLEDEQAVPAEYLTTVTELLDTYVDSASASATSSAASATSAAASAVLADSYIVADLNTSDGQMEALIESPSSLTNAALSATYAPHWKPTTAYVIGDRVTTPSGELAEARTNHTSGATFTGNLDWFIGHQTGDPIPVVKSSTDTRPGVWEFTHNSGTGYIWHLLAGAAFASPASLIALGLDNGNGGGLLVANKASGVGITIRQQATIAATDAYGLKVDGLSTVAPSVRIEQNVDGAADALQLLAFGTPTAAQNLLLVSAGGGNAGLIRAATGIIDWRRDITVRDNGATASGMRVGENSSFATWGDVAGYWSAQVKKGLDMHSPSGGGSLYRFAIETGGSYMNIRTGAAGAYGAAPTYDVIKIRHQQVAFFGSTPVSKPAAIASPTAPSAGYVQAEAAAMKTAVDAIRTTLTALGLTS